MIFIWDNGESYSDHSIEFIDVPPERLGAAMLLFRLKYPPGGNAQLTAVADNVAWLDKAYSVPLYAHFHPDDFLVVVPGGVPTRTPLWGAAGPEVLRWMLAGWRELSKGWHNSWRATLDQFEAELNRTR